MYGFGSLDEEELRQMGSELDAIRARVAVPIPTIRTEADAAIGADGRKLSNYIEENTDVESRPLIPDTEEFGEPSFEPSLSFEMSDSDLTEDRLEEKWSEPSRAEGQPQRPPMTMEELDDIMDFEDVLDAEPYEVAADRTLPPVEDAPFSLMHPKTWPRLFGGGGTNSALQQPLLQGTEMTSLSLAERNLPLAQRPTPFEASPEFGADAIAGLNRLVSVARDSGMSPAAIASEMGIGLSGGGGLWITRASLKEYLSKQGKGLLAAPVLAPLTMLLNDVHDGLGDTFSLGLISGDLIATGDPLGVLLYGLGQAWDMSSKARQAQIANDKPDSAYGSRIGYVREGDTWYPAIYTQRFQSTGLQTPFNEGGRESSMTMTYGHDIVWRVDGTGKWIPTIPGGKSRDFVVSKDEFEGKTRYKDTVLSSRDFVTGNVYDRDASSSKMLDSTRDWFFLSDEDMREVVAGTTVLQSYSDDPSLMNSSARQVNDWRKALDLSQDWRWSSTIQTLGSRGALNSYAGSRGLQRITSEAVRYGDTGLLASDTQDYDQYVKDLASGTGADATSGHSTSDVYGKYILETVLRDHVQALYKTQKAAALEAGFDKLYQTAGSKAIEDSAVDTFLDSPGATVWSAMYLDTDKDMPVATSAEELAEQLHTIETLNDRTPNQRNYLAQKVQTRYWMQQAVSMGRSTELLHMLNGRDWNSGDPYDMKKYTTSATSEYYKGIMDVMGDSEPSVDDYLKVSQSIEDLHLDRVPGFAMPWQNAGEEWLPTLSGSLSGSAKQYMDDFRATNYDRLSAEARDNTARWINETSGLDPNMRLKGIDYHLQEGGLYHDAEDDTTLAFDEFTGEYVGPGENTKKFTEYDPETGDYVLTDAGRAEKARNQQIAADDAETLDMVQQLLGGDSEEKQDEKKQEPYDPSQDTKWSDLYTDDELREFGWLRDQTNDQKRAYAADEKRARGEAYLEAQAAKAAAARARRAAFEESQKNIRTKQDIEAQKRAFAEDDWRKQGIALGLLDPDDDADRPTASQSHGNDPAPPNPVAAPFVGDHPLPHVSASAQAAIAAAIHPPAAPDAVKVV